MNESDPLPVQPPLAPTTTAAEDLTHAGQRQVNLIWEWTQSILSAGTVLSTMGKAIFLAPGEQIPTIMSTATGVVLGFYFMRTNHALIGGVGPKPPLGEYKGR